MLLYELEADPLAIKMVGVVNQIRAEMKMGQRSDVMSEQEFIDALRANEIYINSKQLGNMANSPPLKNMLKIDNHEIKFVGDEQPEELPDIDPEKKAKEDEKTVGSMAKKALKPGVDLKTPDASSKIENPPLKPPPLPK